MCVCVCIGASVRAYLVMKGRVSTLDILDQRDSTWHGLGLEGEEGEK